MQGNGKALQPRVRLGDQLYTCTQEKILDELQRALYQGLYQNTGLRAAQSRGHSTGT